MGTLNRKIRILGIAPYEGMCETMRQVAASFSDRITLDAMFGDLSHGLALAEECQLGDYDVIISRGGTADLLSSHVELPVVNVDVSGYDFMRCIALAENLSGIKALIGFPSITERAKSVNELLKADIQIYTVHSQNEIIPMVTELAKAGCSLIMGDVAACRMAKSVGLNTMLLLSGEESIRMAFERAIQMATALEDLRQRNALLKGVIDGDKQGIAVLGSRFELLYENAALRKLGLTGDVLQEINLSYSGLPEEDLIFKKENKMYRIAISREQGEEGRCYAYVSEIVPSAPELLKGVKITNFPVQEGTLSSRFHQNGIYDPETIQMANAFCKSLEPVLILGDAGVGKTDLCASIHRYSEAWHSPFVQIDCRVTDPAEFLPVFCRDENTGCHNSGAAFCMEYIEALSGKAQLALYQVIQNMPEGTWRFMATGSGNLEALAAEKRFLPELLTFFSALRLYIPGIRGGGRDLQKVVNLQIITANTKYGRQVMGIEPEGMELILNHPWTGNIQELQQTVEQLVLYSKGAVISQKEVHNVLCARSARQESCGISLEGDLEEITLRVLRAVLEEEGGNATKTAQRLGISRSTLWRKLNPQEVPAGSAK